MRNLTAALVLFVCLSRIARAQSSEAAVVNLPAQKIGADDLVAMISDPDIDYTTAPANLMKHVAFMHQVGRLKHLPASWKDLFFAEAHDLSGT